MPYDSFGNYVPFNPYPQNQPAYASRQAQPTNVYAFVNGLEGAKSYIVQPNQTVLLMDSEQPVCYMKTANAMGQGTLRYFKLTEVSEADVRNVAVKEATNDYATKTDLEAIIKRLEKLETKE